MPMTPIAVHPIIFYSLLGMMILLMMVIFYIIIKWWQTKIADYMIFIDKSNRWSMVRDTLKDTDTYSFKNKKYFLTNESGLLTSRGKALYVFSENKPQPMKLEYNNAKWLTSDSMMSIINNKLIQKLVRTEDPFFDKLILFGAIGGLIAGMASILILLKQFGVL